MSSSTGISGWLWAIGKMRTVTCIGVVTLVRPFDRSRINSDRQIRNSYSTNTRWVQISCCRNYCCAAEIYAPRTKAFALAPPGPLASADYETQAMDRSDLPYGWWAPGEYVTIARRHGDEWFLGSMTNWTPRSLDIPLDFLGNGSYTAETYADAADADRFPKNVTIEKKTVDRDTRLKAQLAPAGGYAVRFHRAP
jgi:hypothetical protein